MFLFLTSHKIFLKSLFIRNYPIKDHLIKWVLLIMKQTSNFKPNRQAGNKRLIVFLMSSRLMTSIMSSVHILKLFSNTHLTHPCDLNSSVRGRVSSSRKRFWTLPNLYSEVSALSDSQGYSSSEPV